MEALTGAVQHGARTPRPGLLLFHSLPIGPPRRASGAHSDRMWELWDADRGELLASHLESVEAALALGEWLVAAMARADPGAALCLEVRTPAGVVVAWR